MAKRGKRYIQLQKARISKLQRDSMTCTDIETTAPLVPSEPVNVSDTEPIAETPPVNPVPSTSTSTEQASEKIFVCTLFNESFKSLEGLEEHLTIHYPVVTEELSRSHKKQKLFEKYVSQSELMRNDVDTTSVKDKGNVIVSLSSLNSFVVAFPCSICPSKNSLYCDIISTQGLSNLIEVRCHACGGTTTKWWTSETSGAGYSQFFTINRDSVYASLNSGMGAVKFENLCQRHNLSAMHHTTFHSHASELFKMNEEARKEILKKSAEIVRAEHRNYKIENGIPSEFTPTPDDDETLDIVAWRMADSRPQVSHRLWMCHRYPYR